MREIERYTAVCECPTPAALIAASSSAALPIRRPPAPESAPVVTASFLDWAEPPREVGEGGSVGEGAGSEASDAYNEEADVDPVLRGRADVVIACDCIYERLHATLIMNAFDRSAVPWERRPGENARSRICSLRVVSADELVCCLRTPTRRSPHQLREA